jgi:RHS repeat-associated protein
MTTQFVGSHVEWQSSTSDMVRYYYAGGVRVAMRTGADGLVWLVGDHLGSTSIAVTDASGATERQGYRAWGETRFGSLPTKYQYTGQRSEPELGLYYYGARWYDSELGRWTQPDSIVPDDSGGGVSIVPLTVNFQESEFLYAFNAENIKTLQEQKLAKPHSGLRNSQAFDRYAYVLNNSLKYADPTGHTSSYVFAMTLSAWAVFNSLIQSRMGELQRQALIIGLVGLVVGAGLGGYIGFSIGGPLGAGIGAALGALIGATAGFVGGGMTALYLQFAINFINEEVTKLANDEALGKTEGTILGFELSWDNKEKMWKLSINGSNRFMLLPQEVFEELLAILTKKVEGAGYIAQ